MTFSLKNKIIKLLTSIAILLLLQGYKGKKEEQIINKIPNINIIDNIPMDYKISLFAVGDALIHEAINIDTKANKIDEDGYNILCLQTNTRIHKTTSTIMHFIIKNNDR